MRNRKNTNRLRFKRCQVTGCIMPKNHRGPIDIDFPSLIRVEDPELWHRTAIGWFKL